MPIITSSNNITLLILIAGSQATAISIYKRKKFDACLVYVEKKKKNNNIVHTDSNVIIHFFNP